MLVRHQDYHVAHPANPPLYIVVKKYTAPEQPQPRVKNALGRVFSAAWFDPGKSRDILGQKETDMGAKEWSAEYGKQ
jgi:hypothetical protein